MDVSLPNLKTPLGLPSALFWDVDPGSLDLEKHARQIIGRVLERGGLDGWNKVRRHYGDETLKKVVTSLRSLEPRTLSFLCLMLNLRKEDFRCYTLTPSQAAPWIY